MRVGAIEAGGTKFVCAVGSGPGAIEELVRIPTRGPEETLRDVIGFFSGRQVRRIGLGCFGPLDLKRGAITNTPKIEWRDVPIRSILENALDVNLRVETDVNAAALAEHRWGAAQGVGNFVYVTIGTGIGGGAMVNGQLVHGLMHPEMGHLRIKGKRKGNCPSHDDCWEGYAAGPAIAQFGNAELPQSIAMGLLNIVSVLSPELIILGGGVMKTPGLLKNVREEMKRESYLVLPKLVRPKLGDRAGVLGALVLAQMKL